MANPFKEAEKHKKTPPGSKQEPTRVEEATPVDPVPNQEESAPVQTDPLAGLVTEKPEGKSCGFYLSSEAIKKLDKVAKQNKCSKSKVLDTLIRNSL